jgi:hypothetical protein
VAKPKICFMEQGLYRFAVCKRCNAQFKSSLLYQSAAEKEIRQKFDDHKCKPPDASQNAGRREATEQT